MRTTTKYFEFIFILILIVGCQGAQSKPTATGSAQQASAQSMRQDPQGSVVASKLSPNPTKVLALEVELKLDNVDAALAKSFIKEFRQQMKVFKPCLKPGTKSEMVRLVGLFEVSVKGQIVLAKVQEVVPDSPEFVKCFSSHISKLTFHGISKSLSGQLEVHTSNNGPQTTYPSDHRRFEKSAK